MRLHVPVLGDVLVDFVHADEELLCRVIVMRQREWLVNLDCAFQGNKSSCRRWVIDPPTLWSGSEGELDSVCVSDGFRIREFHHAQPTEVSGQLEE